MTTHSPEPVAGSFTYQDRKVEYVARRVPMLQAVPVAIHVDDVSDAQLTAGTSFTETYGICAKITVPEGHDRAGQVAQAVFAIGSVPFEEAVASELVRARIGAELTALLNGEQADDRSSADELLSYNYEQLTGSTTYKGAEITYAVGVRQDIEGLPELEPGNYWIELTFTAPAGHHRAGQTHRALIPLNDALPPSSIVGSRNASRAVAMTLEGQHG